MELVRNIVVTKINDVTTVFSPKGRYEEMKCRQKYGLSFCKEGKITYIHNGIEYVSDPSNVIILPKGQRYIIRGDKTGSFPVVNFESADFITDKFLLLPIGNTETLSNDYEQMKSLILFERNRQRVMSIFYNMLHNISFADEHKNDTLSPAIRFIEENYTLPDITNETLAKKCNISEVYFRKLFLKNYGTTPKQYIIQARINKAMQLLTDGMMKINTISEICGFTNQYHFCRVFKEKTGLTPTEYMKENRVNKI